MPSLVEAIKHKYDPEEDETDASNVCVLYVPKSGPNIGPSGRLSLPQRLTLDGCCIDKAGDESEIAELCDKVHELDLSKNSITDWHEVFAILRNIPALHFLNLLMNRLEESTTQGISGTYPCMKNLVLNCTMVSWNTVTLLLNAFPSLTELHLSLNQYSAIDLSVNTRHNHLTKLYLNQCRINSWAEVVKLGTAFPKLDFLNLLDTELEMLPEDEESYAPFLYLTTLNVSKTNLKSLEEVDKFRKFPALINLRITEIPVLENWEEKERRQHLVSRLPNIAMLNGSQISDLEREDAERAFIRHYMDQDDPPPRYAELEVKHGKLDPLVNVDLKARTTMKLMVKFEDDSEYMNVDLLQTVKDFKKLLQNFTGLPPSKIRVNYIENFEGRYIDCIPLKLPNKTLLSLNINEGDEFLIERVL